MNHRTRYLGRTNGNPPRDGLTPAPAARQRDERRRVHRTRLRLLLGVADPACDDRPGRDRRVGWPTHLPALMGALLAAFVMTARQHGPRGVRGLVRRILLVTIWNAAYKPHLGNRCCRRTARRHLHHVGHRVGRGLGRSRDPREPSRWHLSPGPDSSRKIARRDAAPMRRLIHLSTMVFAELPRQGRSRIQAGPSAMPAVRDGA
jgi:hypothetical protein